MNKEEFGFDTEFLSDEEVESMLNSIVSTVGEIANTDNEKTSIVNPYKIEHVMYTYKVMKYLTRHLKGIGVSYELYKPYNSMGSVSVVGKNLEFNRPDWFMKAVELSNNFEVYARTDGTVQMNFTFHGLTMPIE